MDNISFIGIDPGKSGAMVALIYSNNKMYYKRVKFNLKEYDNLLMTIKEKQDLVVMMERVWSRPNSMIQSAFTFGENFGKIEGMLEVREIKYNLAVPSVWKEYYKLSGKEKEDSIKKAKELYPGVDLRATDRSKIDSHDVAEALLLANYGKMKYKINDVEVNKC